MVNCLIIKPINQPRFQRRGSLVAYAWVKTRRSGLSKDKIAKFLNNTQPHSKIVNFYAVLSPSWPAKTSVSPRYSPLGTFRAEERLRLRAWRKFHTNDVKSVRTEALQAVCALRLRCIVDSKFSRWRRRSRNFAGYMLYFSIDTVLSLDRFSRFHKLIFV